jgi:predicted hydrocarbon binding protein
MCALLTGIVKGAAAFYKEKVDITESRCMLHGDPACTFTVQLSAKERSDSKSFPKSATSSR